MKINIFFNRKNLFIAFLFLFSLLINQYYGNQGIFPVDSFSHFDTGFRILLGEHPFKDYWIISGPIVDYLQSIFFYFFGVSWQTYLLHASFFNAILTISTFIILTNFNLNIYYSFIYSLLFSVLAYPSSGTPFVDHHSAFFSLLGIYCLILAIKNEEKKYWILLPILFGCAFLSKQVPSSYVILSVILILSIFLLAKKKYYWIKYSFFSATFFIFALLAFGKFYDISLKSFFEQYILYPQSIGVERFSNFNFTFRGVIDHFKFIYLAFIPIFYICIKNFFSNISYIKKKDFYYFLALFLFTFSLIFHQVLTRNQTFIFFLIPILFAFSHIYVINYKIKLSNIFPIILIFLCLLITFKYHLRFNEGRKFHELNYANIQLHVKATNINEKFLGLKWITPKFKDNSRQEILMINELIDYLNTDSRKKMLLTNYSFFSVVLNKKLFSPTRWHIGDGTDYPMKGNKYINSYKNLLIDLIKKNDIKVIYSTYPLPNTSLIYNYINRNCFNEKKIFETLISYEILKCSEING